MGRPFLEAPSFGAVPPIRHIMTTDYAARARPSKAISKRLACLTNPDADTTIGRVTDFRLCQGIPSDQPIDREGSSELVAPFFALAHRLELNLVGQELPEHLSRLGNMTTEQCFHILDLDQELGLDPRGVDVG